jgi:hypothetical protein
MYYLLLALIYDNENFWQENLAFLSYLARNWDSKKLFTSKQNIRKSSNFNRCVV